MVGFGPEISNFVLELTYNYGINEYEFGNDLQYIALHHPIALVRAKALGYTIVHDNIIIGPDNYKYKIINDKKGQSERFAAIGLRVNDLSNSKDYWVDLLGLKVFDTLVGLETSTPSITVGFADEQVKLQLIDLQDNQLVNHALSSGRIAFGCKLVPPIYELVKASSKADKILTPPLTLPTPGKADVVVTILADRDGYEICFVEDIAFYELATPLYDVVDFAERATRGGDGAPPPVSASEPTTIEQIIELDDVEEIAQQVYSQNKILVLDFHAGWCKNCKRISPLIEELYNKYQSKLSVYGVNIDESSDIAIEYEVSTLPRILFFKNGEKIDDYLGSDEKIIESKFAAIQ
eukprot:CAMPEP_0196764598 /NCGR_PEP_ID=MMETSP1095-20130614/6484_1 /TAXON_ID=96789 ORGANISM="Chromulina nebulosa, Strain UTEXLB2642" /NCGR_SAMPLE_ID=MMETSP1095 /ASSEMBLY_ACC=CAM_ASM_000446 /LENGTH=349 /DNA_ID=CAMNT_0042120597 /DNA_START=181 /DNA_END=1230 /DNA_ORIENTATION=+